MRSPDRGFTLIELVVGMVLMAVALTGTLSLLLSQASKATDPVQQVRAAQLAQRVLDEILMRSFDEHSDHNGGHFRCGETAGTPPVTYAPCTDASRYGPDGETRAYQFNDVDDYQTSAICAQALATCDGDWVPANFFSAQSGQAFDESEYRNYGIRIRISGANVNDNPPSACGGTCSIGKRIELWVRLPDMSEQPFVLYRGNY